MSCWNFHLMSEKTSSLNVLMNLKLVRFAKKKKSHKSHRQIKSKDFKWSDWVPPVLHILDASHLKNSKTDSYIHTTVDVREKYGCQKYDYHISKKYVIVKKQIYTNWELKCSLFFLFFKQKIELHLNGNWTKQRNSRNN